MTSVPTNGRPIFEGCMPALMTPCDEKGRVLYDSLVATGLDMISRGMRAVVYCGSMGDWPLLTDRQRKEGVRCLVEAGVPVVVGTGAQNTRLAADHAAHARTVGAHGSRRARRLQTSAQSRGCSQPEPTPVPSQPMEAVQKLMGLVGWKNSILER